MKFLIKTFSLLFFISICVRFVDIFKNLLVASKLGVSDQADVFLAISALPDSLLILFGLDSIRGIVNSEYSYEINKNSELVKQSLSNLFRILFFVGFIISILIVLFRNELINLLLPGFKGNRFALASSISLIILPVFFLKPVQSLIGSYYNVLKKYYYPVLVQVSISIFIIISVFFPHINGEILNNISYGFLLGNIVLFLFIFFRKEVVENIKLSFNFKMDELTKKIIRNCIILLGVVMINQVYLYSRNFFVSYYSEGSVAALNYGSSIPMFISALTFNVVFGVLLNNLSNYHSNNAQYEARQLIKNTINSLIYIYIPIIIIFCVFKINILNILYLRGNFNETGIELTSLPFFWESISLIPFVFFIVIVAVYLGYKEYRKYSYIGVIIYSLGIIVNYLLTKYFGFYGVSIGSFIVNSLMAISLIYFANTIFKNLFKEFSDSFKLILIGITLTLLVVAIKSFILDIYFLKNGLSCLLTGSIIVTILYYIFTIAFKVNYFRKLSSLVRHEN
ncbi:MAG: polysaccharide biosynthesis C-terminal domain-containing protein [Bacteroidota bacterium]|nr:polysaccharide biosynthesis C-terminal domain-containing protein [Bacteroidota bacterium]